jgi:hypothetical protein
MTGTSLAGPSAEEIDAAILERAKSLSNRGCFTVALQRRRLRSAEPEDDTFIFRWWADLEFLVAALRRLRRAAQLATRVSNTGPAAAVSAALTDFDVTLPGLATMRNVGEHIDDYALNAPTRHHHEVRSGQLQVGSWEGTVFDWLGHQLDIDVALAAAEKLFYAVEQAAEQQFRLVATARRPDVSVTGASE